LERLYLLDVTMRIADRYPDEAANTAQIAIVTVFFISVSPSIENRARTAPQSAIARSIHFVCKRNGLCSPERAYADIVNGRLRSGGRRAATKATRAGRGSPNGTFGAGIGPPTP
jgi:hypothetical protein